MAKETMTSEEKKQTIHRMLEAVYKFIKESGYLENPHVLGFTLYGSYTTGYWHSGSDVDMHIIMDNTVSPKDIYRGSKEVDGFNIEFFAAAKSKETKQEKFERLQDLFNYTIRNLNFDPQNYRIRIKDRHGPYCVTHTFIKY